MFYTTPDTSSQSTKLSSVGYEADISEISNISEENIQDNTVDTSKWIELPEEKINALMYSPNTLDDYGKDISLRHTSAETNAKERNDSDKLHKEDYYESKIVGETSQTEGYNKAKQQELNTETYTESTGTNEESTRQKNVKEGVKGNIAFHTDSADAEATSKRESNDKLKMQQDNTEVYMESTGTREISKTENSDKEELQDNTETYSESSATKQTDRIEENDKEEIPHNTEAFTEATGNGKTRIRQGSDKEEEEDKIQVYNESTGTGEMSKIEDKKELQEDNTAVNSENTDTGETSKTEGRNEEKMQQDNTDFYTENISIGQGSKIEGKGKDEVEGNIEVYTENTGTGETSKIEGNDKDEMQDNTEAYTENAGTEERSNIEGNDKEEVQGNTEVYTENTDTGETSKIEGDDKEEVPDNTDVYTENKGTGETSKIEGNDKDEVQDNTEAYIQNADTEERSNLEGNDKEEVQGNTEVYTENTSTGEKSKIEGNDKEEVPENTDVYTENKGTGETSKMEGNDKDEVQDNAKAYTENAGNGERSNIEGNDKEEVPDNTDVYTENKGTGETSKIEWNNKEEVPDNTEAYTENADTGERSNKEGNDKEDVQDNSEVYTANTGTGKTSKIDGKETEDLQVKSEVYTKNTEIAGTSKMEENEKEMQQDNTEIYAASTDTGEVNKAERNDKDKLQHDGTEVYVVSTVTGETRETEGNNTQELQEDGTEVITEGAGNSVPTHRSDEDKADISLGKIKNEVAETWFDETTTTPYHHILKSEEAKNNDSLDEEVSSAHATKTEDNGMVKDGGAVWYIQEARESSTETIIYKTSQETEKHEITGNISEHNQSGSVTDPALYATSVNNREGIMTGFTGGDDGIESLIDTGETDQGKYHEDNTESSNIEHSSTTAVPDRYTQLTVHESRDTIPVVTFQSNMELHDMDLVVPGLDNTKLQVDYDIKTTEVNPVTGTGTEINAPSDYSDVTYITNITDISSENYPNMSDLGDKTLQNSREESENINTDESITSSLAFSTASLTTNPTTDVTSELQNTEKTEASEPTTVQSETAYSTGIHLSVTSLSMHDSATKTQNEEITSSTVDSTTPDILEGEHPLNAKELEQRTGQTDANVREMLQDVTAANSLRDSNNMQEGKAVPHISAEGVSHTSQTSESIMASDWNTALVEETEKSTFFTAGATEASEKILGAVDAFKSNKTANTAETSDILPKEWLKTHHVTTITNSDAVHMQEEDDNKSQTTINHDKAEEFTSTVNYSYDESSSLYKSKSGDKTDQPKETDTSNTEWATESMLTTTDSFENTDKVDFSPNRNDSQMSAHGFFNESRSANEKGTNNASVEVEETTGEQGISTTLNYNSHEKEMPSWNNFFSQHSEKGESSDTSTTDIIQHGDGTFTEGAIFGGQGEKEGWISDAFKKSWNKQPNKFEKNYPESFSTEDQSTAIDQHEPDEPVFAKEVQSAVYSSGSYEMNSHAFYGTGDYYVSSSESGLTYNMTDVHSEATSTVTSTGSEEQSTDLMTARSRDNGNEGRNAQEYTDNETTMGPTESAETNRTQTALESTTPVVLENVHNSTEINKSSEISIKNSLEDSQNAESLHGNVAIWKLEQPLYESSGSHQENYST